MRRLPHAHGFTLNADAFMRSDELVGFVVVHHPINIFNHFHDFFELAFVLQGTGHHRSEAGVQSVRRGSVVFIAPGVSHGYEMCDDLLVLNCFLRVEAARSDLSWALRDPHLGRLFKPSGVTPQLPILLTLDEEVLAVCLAHLEAVKDRPAAERSEAFDLGHLLLVLDLIARELAPEPPPDPRLRRDTPPIVTAAVALVEQDLRTHWTLAELSLQLSVDGFHLGRLFKRWLGLPPIAYANHLRAERAAGLLTVTDDPIASIGAEVGWPDPAHFSRRFRQTFGLSPRAYRARTRGRPSPAEAPVIPVAIAVGG